MFCTKCGNEISDDSDFCPKCGSAQASSMNTRKEEEKIKCPKCGSTQLTSNKKGFSAGKAIGGAILTGGIGLLAGLHGAGKITLTCLKCGTKFKPGILPPAPITAKAVPILSDEEKKKQENNAIQGCIIIVILFVIIFFVLKSCI